MSAGRSVEALCALLGIEVPPTGAGVHVRGVHTDSRRVQQGDLFAAIVGGTHDGTRFVSDAVARGAAAVLTQRPVRASVPVLWCADVRQAVGPVAHSVYGEPTRGWPVVAVTGTNGKTTVAYLVESMLQRLWGPVAVCGTVAMRGPASAETAQLTTPEADALARFARTQRDAGARALVMEASSIALSQGRLGGLQVEVAAYTNLSQDHLDFHGDMHAYGEQKARLFTELAPRRAVVCIDDVFGRRLAERARGGMLWRCSSRPGDVDADVAVVSWSSSREGIAARLKVPSGELSLRSPLIGHHNLQNLVVVLGIACALDLDLEAAAEALSHAHGAPGRMERVADPRGTAIFVDYAHTPAAVARALEALRPITEGRLWIVVGCGGDRDAAKRAPMGRAAVEGADVAVLTSDNPRTEPPEAILEQVCQGARTAGAVEGSLTALADLARGYVREVDRTRAIQATIRAAGPRDTVLIAGKGHEDYQIVGTTKHAFDDRVKAREAVALRGEA